MKSLVAAVCLLCALLSPGSSRAAVPVSEGMLRLDNAVLVDDNLKVETRTLLLKYRYDAFMGEPVETVKISWTLGSAVSVDGRRVTAAAAGHDAFNKILLDSFEGEAEVWSRGAYVARIKLWEWTESHGTGDWSSMGARSPQWKDLFLNTSPDVAKRILRDGFQLRNLVLTKTPVQIPDAIQQAAREGSPAGRRPQDGPSSGQSRSGSESSGSNRASNGRETRDTGADRAASRISKLKAETKRHSATLDSVNQEIIRNMAELAARDYVDDVPEGGSGLLADLTFGLAGGGLPVIANWGGLEGHPEINHSDKSSAFGIGLGVAGNFWPYFGRFFGIGATARTVIGGFSADLLEMGTAAAQSEGSSEPVETNPPTSLANSAIISYDVGGLAAFGIAPLYGVAEYSAGSRMGVTTTSTLIDDETITSAGDGSAPVERTGVGGRFVFSTDYELNYLNYLQLMVYRDAFRGIDFGRSRSTAYRLDVNYDFLALGIEYSGDYPVLGEPMFRIGESITDNAEEQGRMKGSYFSVTVGYRFRSFSPF